MARNKVTYTLFATAGALVILALSLLPHRVHTPPPPPPLPPPPPIVVVPPEPPRPPEPPQPPQPPQVAQPERPRIEVMFVLDTTGSMAGLIDGAKRKIWSI